MLLQPSDKDSEALNAAVATLTQAGGGILRLASGRFRLTSSVVLATQADRTPVYLQFLGSDETVLVWEGPSDGAVFDLQHCQVPTLAHLRIEAGQGHRFRYGIFFRRTHTAQTGLSEQPPPTGLVLRGVTIVPGAGAFTVGLRLGQASDAPDTDQNVDHHLVEDLHIEGASDEPSLLASGIFIDGSQVQGSLFAGITVLRCGIGVLLKDGQCQLLGGRFEGNRSTSHPTGGGDFVFRTGYRAGHLIQSVSSTGSYRFFTNFVEGPPELDLQHDQAIVVALVDCQVERVHPDNTEGDAVYLRGSGGPLALSACDFGPGLHVRVGQYTQGSLIAAGCRFSGPPPHIRVNTWDPTYHPAQPPQVLEVPTPSPSVPLPRSRLARPSIPDRQLNLLARGAEPNNWARDHGPLIREALLDLQRQGGGTLYLPPGLYPVATPIVVQDCSNLALLGVGGRQGAVDLGESLVLGSGLVWTGAPEATLLHLVRCGFFCVEGLGFSPAARPGEGVPTSVETMLRVSQAQGPLWFEELGGGWRGGVSQVEGRGAMKTFLAVEDSPVPVTLRRSTVRYASEQAVLVRGPSDVELQLLVAGPCQRALRVQGGAVRWIGGGANATGQYPDPVLVELESPSATVVLAARECQDDQPCRALRLQGPGTVVFHGDHLLLPSSPGAFIEAPQGELHFVGCGLGVPDAPAALLVQGDRITALGTLYPQDRPWQANRVLDLAGKVEVAGKPWPQSQFPLAPLGQIPKPEGEARSESQPPAPRAEPQAPAPRAEPQAPAPKAEPQAPAPKAESQPPTPKAKVDKPPNADMPKAKAEPQAPAPTVPLSPSSVSSPDPPSTSPVGFITLALAATFSLWLLARRLRARQIPTVAR